MVKQTQNIHSIQLLLGQIFYMLRLLVTNTQHQNKHNNLFKYTVYIVSQ